MFNVDKIPANTWLANCGLIRPDVFTRLQKVAINSNCKWRGGQVGKQEKTVVLSETLERAFIKLNTIANTDRDTNSKTVVVSEKLS